MSLCHTLSSSRIPQFFALGVLLAVQGCKSEPTKSEASPPPATATATVPAKTRAQLTNEFTATSQVVDLSREKRTVTLRREDGDLFTVKVGEAARNFDQIEVGDKVRVRYKESLTAKLLPPGESAQSVESAVASGRTEAGARPGGGVGVASTVRVKIEAIDLSRGFVVFSLASGKLISHRLETSEGREFAKGLKFGDVVQLDYAEGLALTVEEL